MPKREWTLLDCADGTYEPQWQLTSADISSWPEKASVRARRLEGGLPDGVDRITLNNGLVAVDVLPTRGMSLWQATRDGVRFGWQAPVRGPVHPRYVPLQEPSGLGWLDGFDELLVRCGLESNGAPEFDDDGRLRYPLHGRVGNRPAHLVRLGVDDDGTIVLTGEVDDCRFHFAKLRLTSRVTLRPGSSQIELEDVIQNLSDSPATAQMLYHINVGAPVLDAGSRLIYPAGNVVPRNPHAAEGVRQWDQYAAPVPGYEEQVYFMDAASAAGDRVPLLLRNSHGTTGMGVSYERQHLPCFTQWKNTTAIADGYVTGLEPGTNYPNPRSFEGEHNRQISLGPQAAVTLRLQLQLWTRAEEVAAAEAGIPTDEPNIHANPLPTWCA